MRRTAARSIRCTPHILGVLADCLQSWRAVLETELNSANDNPLLDPAAGELLHGGDFYGGHIAQVADSPKTCVPNLDIATVLDAYRAGELDIGPVDFG